MDLSHLDKKYFLDGHRYNCPFCNRGSVRYKVTKKLSFNWSHEKTAYAYVVECQEQACKKDSLHLSYFNFELSNAVYRFDWPAHNMTDPSKFDEQDLDHYFFFHQPTSFFTVDQRINVRLRELLSEAEGCLKMNHLVGASACVRKSIYELIDLEGARKLRDNGRTDYQESIKSLKAKFPRVPDDYFDALGGIQELSSDNVHEGSWPAWDARKLRALLDLTKNVLYEMYVTPEEQKLRVATVASLRDAFQADKGAKQQKNKGDVTDDSRNALVGKPGTKPAK